MKIDPTPFVVYLAAAIGMTWPLAAGIARDVPGDLGDSLLNMWILGWGAEQFPRLDWNANIFHPEPLAIAFSEHLFGEVLQIVPIYYLTHNLILCYNLLFLSSFVLSGLGMYLLVRDVTHDRRAAIVAGLFYAFVPFRVAQIAHIQTINSQWMPLALYGFRRYITGKAGANTAPTATLKGGPPFLVAGSAALLMQNWSCGYYLLYFAPFVAIFVVHQIITNGRAREWKVWAAFAAAAVVVFAGTWPFLRLYLEAARVHGTERPMAEILTFSADVYSYLTAPEALRVWGGLVRAWPKPEGDLFLGFIPALLALVAIVLNLRHASDRSASDFFRVVGRKPPRAYSQMILTALLGIVALALAAGLAIVIFTGGFVTSIAGIQIRATNAPRLLWQLGLVFATLVVVSPRARRGVAAFLETPTGLAAICLLLAVWLSLGPLPHARGQAIPGFGIYGWFLDRVPGVEGLRVPARYAMIAALYLALLAGIGTAWLIARTRRAALVASAIAIVFLVEAAFVPMPINQTWGEAEAWRVPPARVEPASTAPVVYRQLATLPGDLVVAEFPFGDPAWELRYVYYSTVHWKRILNGYSGGFPQGYKVRVARLQRVLEAPNDAWQTLGETGTTHAIVHEGAFAERAQAQAIERWLEERGAREIGRFSSAEGAVDVMYDLRHAR